MTELKKVMNKTFHTNIIPSHEVEEKSSLKRNMCDFEWRPSSSDPEKITQSFPRTIFTANLMGIAWTLCEIIAVIIFMMKICVTFNEGQCEYI